jgi:uncharacterized protein with HEPN domain
MPSERQTAALREILRNIALAEQFAHGHSFETLQGDEKTLYAVVRSLEIISEASRRISDDVKARHSRIEWREMAAAGNIYRHNYEDVTARRGSGTPCKFTCLGSEPRSSRSWPGRDDDHSNVSAIFSALGPSFSARSAV